MRHPGPLLIEHVRADGSWRAWLRDGLAPLWPRMAANCHLNRRSLGLLCEVEFAVRQLARISTGMRPERPIVAAIASRA
jgi:hypothetical protein